MSCFFSLTSTHPAAFLSLLQGLHFLKDWEDTDNKQITSKASRFGLHSALICSDMDCASLHLMSQ